MHRCTTHCRSPARTHGLPLVSRTSAAPVPSPYTGFAPLRYRVERELESLREEVRGMSACAVQGELRVNGMLRSPLSHVMKIRARHGMCCGQYISEHNST